VAEGAVVVHSAGEEAMVVVEEVVEATIVHLPAGWTQRTETELYFDFDIVWILHALRRWMHDCF